MGQRKRGQRTGLQLSGADVRAVRQAERLAFLFHAIKRPRVLHEFVEWEHEGDGGTVHLEGRDGEGVAMTEGEAWQLVALELANLLEQE